MNKTDIARKLAQSDNIVISQASAKCILDEVEDIIKEELINGGSVALKGFLILDSCLKDARMYKHPKTGEMSQSKAHYIPRCKFSDIFKKEISDSIMVV